MKVICKENNIGAFSKQEATYERLKKYINMLDQELDLVVGNEYTVYGVVFWDGSPWYYLCVEGDECPLPFASELFSVSDHKLSSYWHLTVRGKSEVQSLLVFKEWSSDAFFYENLISGDEGCVKIFNKYRQLIDNE